MRKNTARHWLHAALDLLPVILIPVFMIYSHRHDLSTDITIQQDVYKDFYQGVKNGKPDSLDYWTDDNNNEFENVTYNNNLFIGYNYIEHGVTLDTEIQPITQNQHYIYYSFNYFVKSGQLSSFSVSITDIDYSSGMYENITPIYNQINKYSNIWQVDDDYTPLPLSIISYYIEPIEDSGVDIGFNNLMYFDLTQIFGSGNEPTQEVFESYLTKEYYDFGSNQVKVGTVDVPAKNNDIMSVFMDSFNNSVNKYFNMGNVFNMTNVYQWFNTNIFGGTAPVVIYSVWNIVLYEFVMDLLFLLYALFMWFIDMLKRLIEKPLDSIK